MKKVAVILSGCGAYDGAEINEAVLTLLALDRAKAEVTCAAPDIAQKHVINHCTGEEVADEGRNVMIEASRIARGAIQALSTLKIDAFDAIVFVGGYGAAKNLSSFAFDGAAYGADPEVVALIQKAHAQGLALGFMCIAPVLAARALGEKAVQLTIGNDPEIAAALEAKGAKHINCPVDQAVTDNANRVVSTPAYLLAQSITEAEAGINQLVAAVLELA